MDTRIEVNRQTTATESAEAIRTGMPTVRGEDSASARHEGGAPEPGRPNRLSVDPMRATDRYRLVRPGDAGLAR